MNKRPMFPKKRGIGYTRKAGSKRKGVKQKLATNSRQEMNKEYRRIANIIREAEEALVKRRADAAEAKAASMAKLDGS